MNELPKIPNPISVNNLEVPPELQLVIEDIVKAHQENRIISIQRNNPGLADNPEPEQRILIRILNKK